MQASWARRNAVFGLALLAALTATSVLRAQDYFEVKKREMAVQAQQTTADVIAALDKSKELEKTSAAQAKELLQKSLLAVSDSNALDDKQRADLRGRLLARLKEVEATNREQKAGAESTGKAAADKTAREEKERQALGKLQGQQKSIFDQSKDRIDSGKKLLDAQNDLRSAKEKGLTDATLDVLRSNSKTQEQRITSYFIAKSDMRKTSKLSKEEAALLKTLSSTISVDFDKNPFKDVMNYLTDKLGINIFPDTASLKDAGVEYDTPVTFKAGKVTVRTVLKKILGDLGLTYVIMEGNIQVITPDRTKDYMVVRSYPIQDLVAPFDLRWGPIANRIQMNQQASQLIQLIINTVDPSSWQGASERGYGTISYDPATMSLIVRQTAEMHYMLGGGLSR
jgi:hypothetical protein